MWAMIAYIKASRELGEKSVYELRARVVREHSCKINFSGLRG